MTLRETWNDENSDVGGGPPTPGAASSQSTRLGIVPPSPTSPAPPSRPSTRSALVKLGPGVQLPGTAYRITGWLGDGATGVVYRAEHVDLQREVALKILRPEVSDSAAVAEMLRREARNASRLRSEYIVEVHDLGELPDGRVWFAMPLLQGRSLDVVLSHEPMDLGRAVGILRQICKGLHAAHERGIIHRDVKPGNVMLIHDRGRADVVRMLDWGIAVQTPDAKRGASSTAGTPYYIAPEMVSRIPYDHRVDTYSLGCTAFEMLAGRPPFIGSDMASVLVSHVDDAPPDVRSFSPEVPEPLARLVARCLSKLAEDRYQDAADLEAALCEAQCKAKLQTPWDDLPLPDVAPDRRAALASAMPDHVEIATRRWAMPALAGAAAAAVIASLVFAFGRDVGHRDVSQVDQLSTSARRAAAKSFFLYPPVDDPSTDTAYEIVLRLEDLRGDASDLADERAATLRSEFADTLVHLGDKYWERPGGRPFAIDYYAEALIFVPSLDRAATRAALTLGELSDLRSRAGTREFTSMELQAVQPLVALAEPDPQLRARAIQALSDSDDVAVSTARRLSRIVDSDPDIPATAKRRARLRPSTETTSD
ncbi:MAG: serine/threonine protein kinase, partial [Nannocystaceae bacterium]|nr:serine/threonine protein kinase [Nannocystaceae bacterium]